MRAYEALKAGIEVNHRLRAKDLRRLARYIVDNLMENLEGGSGPAGIRTPDLRRVRAAS